MTNANRLKTGDIIFTIGAKTIRMRYTNSVKRAVQIACAMPMRLEGQECYYTIRPDDKVRGKNLRAIYGNFKEYPIGDTCSVTVANQVRSLHVPFSATRNYRGLAKMFGVTKWTIQKILTNRP